MFRAIALGALWRPLGVVYFLMRTKWVLRWNSKNVQNYLKITGLERFWRTLLGTPIWTMWTKITLPCSVALVLHFFRAFLCSVALVLHFWKTFSCSVAHDFIFSEAFPCCVAFIFRFSDFMKRYKNNDFGAWRSFRGSSGDPWGRGLGDRAFGFVAP